MYAPLTQWRNKAHTSTESRMTQHNSIYTDQGFQCKGPQGRRPCDMEGRVSTLHHQGRKPPKRHRRLPLVSTRTGPLPVTMWPDQVSKIVVLAAMAMINKIGLLSGAMSTFVRLLRSQQ